MLMIPAIDLKDGQCVRLFQGDMDQVTVFGDDPAAQARDFAAAGAKMRDHIFNTGEEIRRHFPAGGKKSTD